LHTDPTGGEPESRSGWRFFRGCGLFGWRFLHVLGELSELPSENSHDRLQLLEAPFESLKLNILPFRMMQQGLHRLFQLGKTLLHCVTHSQQRTATTAPRLRLHAAALLVLNQFLRHLFDRFLELAG